MDSRHSQNITFGDIDKAFGEARKTPYFDEIPRKFHSFIVTSDQNATIKDLKDNYKKKRKGDKATIFFDEFHNATVTGINIKLKPGKTTKYEVVSCTQYNQGSIQVTAKTFFEKSQSFFTLNI